MRITTHPGEILREEFLTPLEMTANALARALSVDAPRINDVVRGRRGISADTALRLARYFNTTPEFWLNLQRDHDLSKARAESSKRIEKEVSPRAA
jgi:addiction module HigA family antidote